MQLKTFKKKKSYYTILLHFIKFRSENFCFDMLDFLYIFALLFKLAF